MPRRLRLLGTLRHKVELDRNIKFTPSRLFDLERWSLYHTQAVGVGVMEFKLHFLEPGGYISAINTTDKDFPTMCMVGGGVFGTVRGVKRCGF